MYVDMHTYLGYGTADEILWSFVVKPVVKVLECEYEAGSNLLYTIGVIMLKEVFCNIVEVNFI